MEIFHNASAPSNTFPDLAVCYPHRRGPITRASRCEVFFVFDSHLYAAGRHTPSAIMMASPSKALRKVHTILDTTVVSVWNVTAGIIFVRFLFRFCFLFLFLLLLGANKLSLIDCCRSAWMDRARCRKRKFNHRFRHAAT